MPHFYSTLISSLGLPWVSIVTQSDFWRLYQEFHQSPSNSLFAPTASEVLGKVRKLLKYAYDHVPFYSERLNALGLTPESFTSFEDLRQLPPLTKADISANFPDRITSSRRDFLPWRYASTSGTIQRLTVVQDYRKRDFVRAAQLFALNSATGYMPGMKYLEIPPDICTDMCGATETVEPSLLRFFIDNLKSYNIFDAQAASDLRGLIERQLVYRRLQLPSLGPEGFSHKQELLDDYLHRITEYRPYIVKALPAYLHLLAQRIIEGNLRPPLIEGGVMPMGSSLTPGMKRLIEKSFNCKVHEDYGCAELGTIATECGHQNGLHVFATLFHVEVVRKGRPVEDGEIGRVLVTDLTNYAMPLIRYDIGDVAVLRRGVCRCGLSTDRLNVQGRVQDCIVRPDGTVLTPDSIADFIFNHPGILGFQLEWRKGGHVRLDVLPTNSTTPDLEGLKYNLQKFLGEGNIATQTVSMIRPESGGKYRFVKNLSPVVEQLH